MARGTKPQQTTTAWVGGSVTLRARALARVLPTKKAAAESLYSECGTESRWHGEPGFALQAKMSETPSGFRAHSLKPTLPLRTGRTNFNPKLMMRDGDREIAEQLEKEERHKVMI